MGCSTSKLGDVKPHSDRPVPGKPTHSPEEGWAAPVSYTTIILPNTSKEQLEILQEPVNYGGPQSAIGTKTFKYGSLIIRQGYPDRLEPPYTPPYSIDQPQSIERGCIGQLVSPTFNFARAESLELTERIEPTYQKRGEWKLVENGESREEHSPEPVRPIISESICSDQCEPVHGQPLMESRTVVSRAEDGTIHLINRHYIHHPEVISEQTGSAVHIALSGNSPIAWNSIPQKAIKESNQVEERPRYANQVHETRNPQQPKEQNYYYVGEQQPQAQTKKSSRWKRLPGYKTKPEQNTMPPAGSHPNESMKKKKCRSSKKCSEPSTCCTSKQPSAEYYDTYPQPTDHHPSQGHHRRRQHGQQPHIPDSESGRPHPTAYYAPPDQCEPVMNRVNREYEYMRQMSPNYRGYYDQRENHSAYHNSFTGFPVGRDAKQILVKKKTSNDGSETSAKTPSIIPDNNSAVQSHADPLLSAPTCLNYPDIPMEPVKQIDTETKAKAIQDSHTVQTSCFTAELIEHFGDDSTEEWCSKLTPVDMNASTIQELLGYSPCMENRPTNQFGSGHSEKNTLPQQYSNSDEDLKQIQSVLPENSIFFTDRNHNHSNIPRNGKCNTIPPEVISRMVRFDQKRYLKPSTFSARGNISLSTNSGPLQIGKLRCLKSTRGSNQSAQAFTNAERKQMGSVTPKLKALGNSSSVNFNRKLTGELNSKALTASVPKHTDMARLPATQGQELEGQKSRKSPLALLPPIVLHQSTNQPERRVKKCSKTDSLLPQL